MRHLTTLLQVLLITTLCGFLGGCGTSSIPAGGLTASGTTPVAAPTQAETRTAPAAEVSQAATSTSTTAPLGINLEAQSDYSRSLVFVDAIKTSRKFGSVKTPWDKSVPVDANGWPTSDFGVVAFTSIPHGAGTYLLSFTGSAQVAGGPSSGTVTVDHKSYTSSTNTTQASVTLGPNPSGNDSLMLVFTGTNGGARNIRLLRPGYAAGTTQVFNTAFVNRLQPFTTLRAMDIQQTNNNSQVNWSDRPLPTDAQQTSARGVALEYLVALANQTNKDLWVCVPDQATDDYVRQMATLLKSTLNPNLKLYVEWSNEVWNGQFQQAQRNAAAAIAEGNSGASQLNDFGAMNNQGYWAWRRWARRVMQVSQIFQSVFGPNSLNSRVRPVLTSQNAYHYMLDHQLGFIQTYYGAPSQYLYAVAGAPYMNLGNDEQNTSLTVDQIIADLNTSMSVLSQNFVVDPTYNGTLDWNHIPTYATLASYYHLQNVTYEGGPSTPGSASLAAKIAANHDPRMASLITNLLKAWYHNGNSLFMYYEIAADDTQAGEWGLYQDITQDTVKSQAVVSVAGQPLSNFR